MAKKTILHRGLSGFGYCVICGLKPGNARFIIDNCPGDWAAY